MARVLGDLNSYYILGNSENFLTSSMFYDQYRTLLAERGFLTRRGMVRNVDFMNAFVDYYTPSLLYRLNCEMNQNIAHSSWLIRSVTGADAQNPPLHHILIIHFLGSRAEDFFCQKVKLPPPFGKGPWPCLNPVCKHYQQKCIDKCNVEQEYEKGNKFVGWFKCECGFTYIRIGPDHLSDDAFRKDRVISYGEIWEEKLRELWLDPTITRRDIARHLGISERHVTNRAIKQGLDGHRISPYKTGGRPRKIRNIQEHRAQWLAHVETAPENGITSLRDAAPGLYLWLYKNDREWLIIHRPPSKIRRLEGGLKKNLTFQSLKAKLEPQDKLSRDTIIAEAVKDAARQIILVPGPPKRVSIASICSYIPQLGWLRKKKSDEIPLTIQALKEVVETQEDFAIRRIWWLKQQYKDQ